MLLLSCDRAYDRDALIKRVDVRHLNQVELQFSALLCVGAMHGHEGIFDCVSHENV